MQFDSHFRLTRLGYCVYIRSPGSKRYLTGGQLKYASNAKTDHNGRGSRIQTQNARTQGGRFHHGHRVNTD